MEDWLRSKAAYLSSRPKRYLRCGASPLQQPLAKRPGIRSRLSPARSITGSWPDC